MRLQWSQGLSKGKLLSYFQYQGNLRTRNGHSSLVYGTYLHWTIFISTILEGKEKSSFAAAQEALLVPDNHDFDLLCSCLDGDCMKYHVRYGIEKNDSRGEMH